MHSLGSVSSPVCQPCQQGETFPWRGGTDGAFCLVHLVFVVQSCFQSPLQSPEQTWCWSRVALSSCVPTLWVVGSK